MRPGGKLRDQRDCEDGQRGRRPLTSLLFDLTTHRVEAERPAEQPESRHGRRGERKDGRSDGRRISSS
jgi:hypothetical protein